MVNMENNKIDDRFKPSRHIKSWFQVFTNIWNYEVLKEYWKRPNPLNIIHLRNLISS